jgi:hypothetical protein
VDAVLDVGGREEILELRCLVELRDLALVEMVAAHALFSPTGFAGAFGAADFQARCRTATVGRA